MLKNEKERVHSDAFKYCPLMKKDIRRAACYEIEEVREDNMDMELCCVGPFDLEEAEIRCKECGWFDTYIK